MVKVLFFFFKYYQKFGIQNKFIDILFFFYRMKEVSLLRELVNEKDILRKLELKYIFILDFFEK